MKYDFTSILNRHGQDAIAVDALGKMPGMSPEPPQEGFDFIPMWVADMNFPVVSTIQEAIIERAPQHLAAGGVLLLEHGYDQGEAVRAMLSAAGFEDVRTVQDLAGNDRVSGGRRRP